MEPTKCGGKVFLKKKTDSQSPSTQAGDQGDFAYLPASAVYFDSACQSLRPQCVIQAMAEYYTSYNSCGERVKYDWGLKVDRVVDETRQLVLKLLKLSPRKYFVSFTENTTCGLNLVLSQLKSGSVRRVVTSDIEHNSVFLSTMSCAERLGVPREVLTRRDDGSIDLTQADFRQALVVLNAVSNIDGRQLGNIQAVAKQVHDQGGIFVVDAAQTMSYYHQLIAGVEADAICFSSHKMYGPSLGVIVAKKSLVDKLQPTVLGGGMVDDVDRDNFVLSATNPEHLHTIFEPGLQAYAEIIGLGQAIRWLTKAEQGNHVAEYSQQLLDFLRDAPGFHVLNQSVTPTIAFYHDQYDAHLLAEAMSDQGIMARSGHFCAHYYLGHVKQYPPLVRLSLGLHNRSSDIAKFIDVMKGLAK